MRKKRTRAQRIRRLLIVAGLLLLLIATAPMIIAKTPLRNVLLSAALADKDIQASTGAASFGWFSSLSVSQLQITDSQQQRRIEVGRVSADRSWLSILLGLPNLGSYQFQRPVVDWTVGEPASQSASEGVKVTFAANVDQAAVRLRHPALAQPIVDLSGMDLAFRLYRDGEWRFFEIDPVQILDHQPLTNELCRQGLQLVAPIMADQLDVEGEVSFALTSFRVPVDMPDAQAAALQTDISGTIQLHRAAARLKNPITVKVAQLVAGVLRLPEVPDEIRVAENAQLQFEVRQGRVYHDSLTFMFPQVAEDFWVQSTGSVGLDETLDLTVTTQLPFTVLREGDLAKKLSQIPLVFHITGTLQAPKIGLPEDQHWLTQLGEAVFSETLGDDDNDLADQLLSRLEDLFGGLQRQERLLPPLPPRLKMPDAQQPDGDRPIRALLDRLRDRLRNEQDDK